MRVALVYDRVNKWGGAERLLLALHKVFPKAALYTSVYDPKSAPWANVFDVRTSFLQKIPFATRHELFALLMPLAFESFNFDKYDLVISVTSESAKGIITKPNTRHICYCLTPTRYLWSGYDEYFKNGLLRILSKPAVAYLRYWDRVAANRPDKFIAISKEVQKRIKKCYGRVSEVVYPPVEMSNVISIQSGQVSSHKSQDYFLIVSRLVAYKKIDLAIRAFNKLKLPLVIVGIGHEMNNLISIAGPTIKFAGSLTDKELVEYYKGCKALIFPGIEDFGLNIVEAQSFGKPVIAFKAGGALETVSENKTGVFFEKQNVEGLICAVSKLKKISINPKTCMKNAGRFSFEIFKKKILLPTSSGSE